MNMKSLKNSPTQTNQGMLVCLCAFVLISFIPALSGCTRNGYSNDSLFPQDIVSVRLEMFDNQSFRRGLEYELSDALAKRIEADTPYKIVSNKDRADTVISGYIESINATSLTTEREIGRALEKEVRLKAVVNWKNLKTGELLIDSQAVTSEATYSEYQRQGFGYASTLAANKMAKKIVELMQEEW